jgi:hypothetical protein
VESFGVNDRVSSLFSSEGHAFESRVWERPESDRKNTSLKER